MKKMVLLLFVILFVAALSSCGTSGNSNENNTTKIEQSEKTLNQEKKTYTVEEFEALLQSCPVPVIKTKYTVQDADYKALYPDLLQAVIQNNTQVDIKDAVIAFVGWDKNGLPVKLIGNLDFDDGQYVQLIAARDINLVPNATYGESNGYGLDEACQVTSFKALVVSYETFEGDTWENPYYDEFVSLYEGKKLSGITSVDVTIE